MQALAAEGMGPKLFAYIDKKGRPVSVTVLQLIFGCLAFINLAPSGGDIFNWLLALSSLSTLFVYSSTAVAHIRFRSAWKANGHTLDELPFKAAFGVWGSWLCFLITILALMGQFYVALYPVGGPNLDPNTFFQAYLAGPVIIALYLAWKVYSWFYRPEHRPLYIKIKDIDIYSGMRQEQMLISGADVPLEERHYKHEKRGGALSYVKRIVGNVW
jgi:amino acid transporter